MKTHYGDTFWGVMFKIFQGCACWSVSHLKLLKYFHNNFSCDVRIYLRHYKMGNWNIFVETNVVYLYTQKHKYTPNFFNDF